MKKQRFFMLGITTVLVAVLSLTFVSSTFAKYTSSGSATDTARVAKWGVNVSVSGNEAFKEEYDGAIGASSNTVVTSVPTETVDDVTTPGQKILAPGTHGELGGIEITGQPEVAVTLDVTFDLQLTDWQIGQNYYCPIIFTVVVQEWVDEDDPNTQEVESKYYKTTTTVVEGWKVDNRVASYKDTNTIETEVASLVNALDETSTVSPNTDLKREVSISWRWAFDSDELIATAEREKDDAQEILDDNNATAEEKAAANEVIRVANAKIALFEATIDVNDTALGNLPTAPKISATWNAEVTQVD